MGCIRVCGVYKWEYLSQCLSERVCECVGARVRVCVTIHPLGVSGWAGVCACARARACVCVCVCVRVHLFQWWKCVCVCLLRELWLGKGLLHWGHMCMAENTDARLLSRSGRGDPSVGCVRVYGRVSNVWGCGCGRMCACVGRCVGECVSV